MWVQVHDLPMGLMKVTVGTQLANYIRAFVEYDKNNNLSFWRHYIRIRVKIDVRMPLKKDTKVKNKEGNWCTVNFKYEKLGTFCFVCGVMGHAENKCEVRFSIEHDDGTRNWSADIRADARRTGGKIVSRWLKEERGNSVDKGSDTMAGQPRAPGKSSIRGPTHADVASAMNSNIPNCSTTNHAAIITRQDQLLALNHIPTPPTDHNLNEISPLPQNLNASYCHIKTFPAFISQTKTSINNTIPLMSADTIITPCSPINSPMNTNQSIPITLTRPKMEIHETQLLTYQPLTFTSQPKATGPQPLTKKSTRIARVSTKTNPDSCSSPKPMTDLTLTRSRPEEKKTKPNIPTRDPTHPAPGPTPALENTEDMELQCEKKRRREEGKSTSNENSQTYEHFLTAGPRSQACRDQ
jgi:hypothetical protein